MGLKYSLPCTAEHVLVLVDDHFDKFVAGWAKVLARIEFFGFSRWRPSARQDICEREWPARSSV